MVRRYRGQGLRVSHQEAGQGRASVVLGGSRWFSGLRQFWKGQPRVKGERQPSITSGHWLLFNRRIAGLLVEHQPVWSRVFHLLLWLPTKLVCSTIYYAWILAENSHCSVFWPISPWRPTLQGTERVLFFLELRTSR